MTQTKKNILFAAVTAILILIAAFCIGATAISQTKISSRAEDNYRKSAEKEYVTELRTRLEAKGYHNSGVTLTSKVDEQGTRTYTATIHHERIDNLKEEAKTLLKLELASISFPGTCTVRHEFLITN